jgi:hypothetical protein
MIHPQFQFSTSTEVYSALRSARFNSDVLDAAASMDKAGHFYFTTVEAHHARGPEETMFDMPPMVSA